MYDIYDFEIYENKCWDLNGENYIIYYNILMIFENEMNYM